MIHLIGGQITTHTTIDTTDLNLNKMSPPKNNNNNQENDIFKGALCLNGINAGALESNLKCKI